MAKQLAAIRMRFAEEGPEQGSHESGVLSRGSARAEGCRMCKGTGIRREQRVPDQAIAEIGTFCRCEAGRGRWEKCVRVVSSF